MLSKIKTLFKKPPVKTTDDYVFHLKMRELNLKFARENFKRVVCWSKRLVWNAQLGRMEKVSKAKMPAIGFECSACPTLGPLDHFMIEGQNFCEDCAVGVVEAMKQIALKKSKKGASVPGALLE